MTSYAVLTVLPAVNGTPNTQYLVVKNVDGVLSVTALAAGQSAAADIAARLAATA